MPRINLRHLGALFATIAVATPTSARSANPYIPLGVEADAPEGFVALCERDESTCGAHAPRTGPAPTIAVAAEGLSPYFHSAALAAAVAITPTPTGTNGLGRLARSINIRVNRAVVQRSDLARFGVDERWERTGSERGATGDCEDIALEKRAQLIDAGFPADRLFLATVFRGGVGLHTVLIARLDGRDVVLDSLTSRMLGWTRARYSWLRIQTPGQPWSWRRLGAG